MLQLTARQYILFAIAAVICLVALLQWGVLPLANYYSGLEQDISASRQRLQRIMELQQKYEQVRSRAGETGDAGALASDFSLYSFLDQLAEQQGLKGSTVFMRPSTNQLSGGLKREVVYLRLRGLGMKELVSYLYHLDQAESPVRVGDMTIRSRGAGKQGLQVDLRVFVLKG